MPRHDELTVLLRSPRQLAKLCRDGVALVAEAGTMTPTLR
jgi:hypothetical protein